MGFMDKVKAQANQLAQKAQETAHDGIAKFDQAQANRRADAMLRNLGALVYADRTGRGAPDAQAQIDRLINEISAHEAQNGINLAGQPVDPQAPGAGAPGFPAAAPGSYPPPPGGAGPGSYPSPPGGTGFPPPPGPAGFTTQPGPAGFPPQSGPAGFPPSRPAGPEDEQDDPPADGGRESFPPASGPF
jgi:hypothetical protein